MKRVLVILTLCIVTVTLLDACSNTFNGIGQDMEHNGQAIQRQF